MLRITRARTPAPTSLFSFLVLGSRFFQNGDVRVGVFPGSVAAADSTNHTGEDARAYIAIFVSRTRLSLPAGWGCQGRRLSRECSRSTMLRITRARTPAPTSLFYFSYSAFASFRMGMSGSASFQRLKKF